jgi:hypothetical protein
MQARKLEGELDVKLASYGKLSSGFEAGSKGPGSAAAADQVCRQVNRARVTTGFDPASICAVAGHITVVMNCHKQNSCSYRLSTTISR